MPEAKFDKYAFDTDFFEVAIAEAKANAPAGALREQAYGEGLAAGRKQAEQAMQGPLLELTHIFNQALQNLQQEQEKYLQALEDDVIAFVFQALQTILHHAAEHYPADLLDTHLRAALQHIPRGVTPELRLHPTAMDLHHKLTKTEITLQNQTLKLAPDTSVQPGDCILTWPGGGLSATLHTAIDKLAASLGQPAPTATTSGVASDTVID